MTEAEYERNREIIERKEGMRNLVEDYSLRQKVYICSNYGSRGDKATNLELAKAYCSAVIDGGHTPICPHLFLHDVLNDEVETQRHDGLEIGLHLLEDCDVLLVCSQLSDGMIEEICKAWEWGIPVEVMNLEWLYQKEAAGVEEEIKRELRDIHGQVYHSTIYR